MTSWSSPGTYTYDIPSTAVRVDIVLRGGDAGTPDTGYYGSYSQEFSTSQGGDSAEVTASFDPADLPSTLTVVVGGDGEDGNVYDGGADGGSGGYNGGGNGNAYYSNDAGVASGGGGGSSEIQDSNGNRIAVAGGSASGVAITTDTLDNGVSDGGNGGNYAGQDGGDTSRLTGGAGGSTGLGTRGGGNAVTCSGGGAIGASGAGGAGASGGGSGDADSSASGDGYTHATGGGGGSSYVDSAATSSSVSVTTSSQYVEITVAEVPAAPNNTSQTVEGDDQIQVDADEDTSAGAYDNYRIEVSEDGGSYSLVAEPTSMPYTYTANTATDEHKFRVRAENSNGVSDWTYTTTKSTDITSVSTSNVGGTSFDLSWDAADDATDYDVLLAESSGSTEADYAIDQTVTTTSATVSGLENGEKYYARAIARYPQEDSLSTVETSATTTVPSPSIDSVDTSVVREVTVNYTLNDNSTDGDVLVELSSDGGTTWGHSQTVSDLSVTSVTFTALLDGLTYTARVTRRTDHDSSKSPTAKGTTILPAVTNIRISSSGETTLTPAWDDNSNNESGFRVYWSRDDGETWSVSPDLSAGTTQHQITGLKHGEQYRVAVEVFTADASTMTAPGLRAP